MSHKKGYEHREDSYYGIKHYNATYFAEIVAAEEPDINGKEHYHQGYKDDLTHNSGCDFSF